MRTLQALGLRRIRAAVVHDDTPVIRGMIARVSYAVQVEPVEGDDAPAAGRSRRAEAEGAKGVAGEGAFRMKLGDLRPPRGARKRRKRVGRGPASGHGKTSTKGHKGHKARSGGGKGPGFEGGQMPLYRRIPKRGFKNPFHREFAVINVSDLARCFPKGGDVGPEALVGAGLLATRASRLVKVLADGELAAGTVLTVRAHAFSKAAAAKIAAAGGRVEVLPA